MNKDINYYELLQINHNFDSSELKHNYRSLSKKYHPDKSSGNSDLFKLFAEGYKILSTDDLKEKYDKTSKYGASYDSFLELLDFDFDNSNVSSNKIYDKMGNYKKQEMIHIVLEFPDLPKVIEYERNIICSKCEGHGNLSAYNLNLQGKMGDLFMNEEIPCDICDGTGTYNSRECPGCKGEGYIKIGFSSCDKCNGKGIIEVKKKITEFEEKDFINGKLKFTHFGNQSKYSGITGNLYVIVKSLLNPDLD